MSNPSPSAAIAQPAASSSAGLSIFILALAGFLVVTTEFLIVGLLPALPEGFAPAVTCILHVPPDRDSRLAELFAARTALPVREAQDKE
ncbi:hypothetical protein FPK46_23830, partial [Acinetobacter baumannii]|nr:hypothetical protein [Acinetobacter baumannii]